MNVLDFFVSTAQAAPANNAAPQGGELFPMIMLIIMFAVFYFLIIRPQRKRQKDHEAMLETVSQGDEVATHAGMLGKVRSVKDNYIILKVADNVELKFQKSAVSVILPKGTIKDIA